MVSCRPAMEPGRDLSPEDTARETCLGNSAVSAAAWMGWGRLQWQGLEQTHLPGTEWVLGVCAELFVPHLRQ